MAALTCAVCRGVRTGLWVPGCACQDVVLGCGCLDVRAGVWVPGCRCRGVRAEVWVLGCVAWEVIVGEAQPGAVGRSAN